MASAEIVTIGTGILLRHTVNPFPPRGFVVRSDRRAYSLARGSFAIALLLAGMFACAPRPAAPTASMTAPLGGVSRKSIPVPIIPGEQPIPLRYTQWAGGQSVYTMSGSAVYRVDYDGRSTLIARVPATCDPRSLSRFATVNGAFQGVCTARGRVVFYAARAAVSAVLSPPSEARFFPYTFDGETAWVGTQGLTEVARCFRRDLRCVCQAAIGREALSTVAAYGRGGVALARGDELLLVDSQCRITTRVPRPNSPIRSLDVQGASVALGYDSGIVLVGPRGGTATMDTALPVLAIMLSPRRPTCVVELLEGPGKQVYATWTERGFARPSRIVVIAASDNWFYPVVDDRTRLWLTIGSIHSFAVYSRRPEIGRRL
jgi:hypothetical protein